MTIFRKYINTIKLEQNYRLSLVSIDASGPVRSAVLDLNPGERITILYGENFSIYRKGTLVVEGRLDSIFIGATAELIQIRNLVQYDEDGSVILATDKVTLFRPYHPPVRITPATETFKLKPFFQLLYYNQNYYTQ